MTTRNKRAGFTLLEMLVASLLLSMLVVALSMVFSSSASAWRIGRAGVDGLHDMRHRLSEYQLAADNALPNLKGEGTGIGYVRSVWVNGSSLIDQDGDNVSNGRVVDMIGFTPQEHPGQPFTEDCLLFPYPVSEKRLNANLQNITVAERLAL